MSPNNAPSIELAILVAIPQEAQGTLRAGQWRPVELPGTVAAYVGEGAEAGAFLAVSGVGPAMATDTTRAVLREYGPGAVLSMGYAGGLAGGQRPGDLVVAASHAPMPGGDPLPPSLPDLVPTDPGMVGTAIRVATRLGLSHKVGLMLASNRVLASSEEKVRMGLETGAVGVDMESYWMGVVCQESGVPFVTARVVVDTAEHAIPVSVARRALGAGLKRPWPLAFRVALAPWGAPGLVRLSRAAARARATLTAFGLAWLDDRGKADDA